MEVILWHSKIKLNQHISINPSSIWPHEHIIPCLSLVIGLWECPPGKTRWFFWKIILSYTHSVTSCSKLNPAPFCIYSSTPGLNQNPCLITQKICETLHKTTTRQVIHLFVFFFIFVRHFVSAMESPSCGTDEDEDDKTKRKLAMWEEDNESHHVHLRSHH